MKIIRHSHKMFVYSLSLLLYAQQISCMQQPVVSIDTSGHEAIMKQIKALNSTNARIDMMQTMLGSIIKNTELKGTSVALAKLENVPLDNITINSANAEETQQKLIDMQQQVLHYKAQYLFSMSERQKTRANEITANTLTAAVAGFVFNRNKYQPNLNVITGGRGNLPDNPRDLDGSDLINALKLALGDVPDNAIFLKKPVETYKSELEIDHTFFLKLETSCCCATPDQREEALKYKIKWRALAIPLLCFAQKQEALSQLKIITASQATAPTASPVASCAPPPQHLQPQFSKGQPVYGTLPQHQDPPAYFEKPRRPSQDSDLGVGVGFGSINNNDNK